MRPNATACCNGSPAEFRAGCPLHLRQCNWSKDAAGPLESCAPWLQHDNLAAKTADAVEKLTNDAAKGKGAPQRDMVSAACTAKQPKAATSSVQRPSAPHRARRVRRLYATGHRAYNVCSSQSD